MGCGIAKAIVEKHGRRISFETMPRMGMIFFVDLTRWQPIGVDEAANALTAINREHDASVALGATGLDSY